MTWSESIEKTHNRPCSRRNRLAKDGVVSTDEIPLLPLHYFETNNLFYDEQYGFRKNYSTKLSLASLVNVMSKSLDEGKITMHGSVY